VCGKLLRCSDARLVFRHGDLSIDNILVCETGNRLALIDWEWSGVVDERDVWLEARELLRAIDREEVWRHNVPASLLSSLLVFEDIKNIAMGVSFSLATSNVEYREEELDVLEEALAQFGKRTFVTSLTSQ
jgi:hypothetical protein